MHVSHTLTSTGTTGGDANTQILMWQTLHFSSAAKWKAVDLEYKVLDAMFLVGTRSC